MIKVPAILVDGALVPSQEFPEDAVHVVFDGTDYCVYQRGDEVPAQPTLEE